MLVGRDVLVARLAASKAPLTLLTGDSGIGKSEVLRAAQVGTVAAVAPAPLTLPFSGGVLQRVLLNGLADVLAYDVAQRGGLENASRHVVEVAKRLVTRPGKELAGVIAQELLAVVRTHLGLGSGAATSEFIASVKQSGDERLAVRLDNALDRGAAQLVVEFAGEVLAYLDSSAAVLALDAGERLPDADVRVLGDLASALPAGLRLRVAVSTYTAKHRATAEQLRNVGPVVSTIALEGLPVAAVASWLAEERLPQSLASEVTRVTGGYPLHVGDLVVHLRNGGSVDDGALNEVFRRRTDEAWTALDLESASCARRLCVLADPLPTERVMQLLALEAPAWSEVQDRLQRARIFSVTVNGLPWFHEQRRRYLSEIKLNPYERGIASAKAVEVLEEMTIDSGRTDRIAELAVLAASATPLLEGSERLRAAIGLGQLELSLCAALMELIEPDMDVPAIAGDDLLRYAKTVFGAQGDLIAAFRELERSPLITVAEEANMALVTPRWESTRIKLVIAGRAERELGRGPVPGAAGVVFKSEIAPRLVPFSGAGYGSGDASMATLGREAIEWRRRLPGSRFVANRESDPNLLLRGQYAGRRVFCHACFEGAESRDAALGTLSGHEADVFGECFMITEVLAHPLDPVPARRFLLAAHRLLGSDLQLDGGGLAAKRRLGQPVDAEERLRARLAMNRLIRARCDRVEAYALTLDRPMGYFFYADEEHLEFAEILGGTEDIRRSPTPLGIIENSPFRVYRIDELASIRPNERVGRMSFRGSRTPIFDDPAVEALNDYASWASAFNEVQRRLELPLDPEELQRRIHRAVNQRFDDARALQKSGLLGEGLDDPRGMLYELELATLPSEAGRWVGPFWSGQLVVSPHVGAHDVVEVTISNGPLARPLPDVFGDGVSGTRGPGEDIVAELLGHRPDDFRFTYDNRSQARTFRGSGGADAGHRTSE